MNKQQKYAVKYAFADLCGAMQSYIQGDIEAHDWQAHMETILDMKKAFDFLDEIPADLQERDE
jgi:hypothetical protein